MILFLSTLHIVLPRFLYQLQGVVKCFLKPKTQQFSSVSSWALSILGFLILLNVLEKSHDKMTFSVQTDNSAMK